MLLSPMYQKHDEDTVRKPGSTLDAQTHRLSSLLALRLDPFLNAFAVAVGYIEFSLALSFIMLLLEAYPIRSTDVEQNARFFFKLLDALC